MRTSLPEYVKPIASHGGEIVLSTPAWYAKHGADKTVFVDASTWPPRVVEHGFRVGAAARLPSKQWVCAVHKGDGVWELAWYDDIHATAPSRVEPSPIATTPDAVDGPIKQLIALADVVVAIPEDGAVFVRGTDGWRAHPTLVPAQEVRCVRYLDDVDVLAWDATKLYGPGFEVIDARGCSQLVRVPGGPLLAVHDEQLVEVTANELIPRMSGHDVHALEAGPGGAVWLTLRRDDERGTHFDHMLFDPRRNAVTPLTEALVGRFPAQIAFTDAHGMVLHDDNKHELFECSASDLGVVPVISVNDLPVPERIELDVLDEIGAASRPVVATTGDHIAIAVGRFLRLHTVDKPTNVLEHDRPVVGVVAIGSHFAVLDSSGLVLECDGEGTTHLATPTVAVPRSIAALDDGWVVVGHDRIVVARDRRAISILIAKPLAVAEDPHGELVIASEDHRLACWTGTELLDLPPTSEQLVAVTALGDRRFACLGRRNLYLLDLRLPELTPLHRRLRRPHLASIPDTGRMASCDSPASVETDDFDGDKLVKVSNGGVRYSTYRAPDESPVVVHGVAFMDDGRLVIALDEGRANIVNPDTASALKLDPQPGDVQSRWMFFCGGKILIAD